MTKDVKLIPYPVVVGIIGVVGGGLGMWFLGRLWWGDRGTFVPVVPSPMETSATVLPSPPQEMPQSAPQTAPQSNSQGNPQANPQTSPQTNPQSVATAPSATVAQSSPASAAAAQPGKLRVSNQTDYPIRVALLAQLPSSGATTENSTRFREPVHWDFAPNEGSARGLILSLPDSDLRLQDGDILVAFAQDGSRRYWGPYVVSQTSSPRWDAAAREWRLVIQP